MAAGRRPDIFWRCGGKRVLLEAGPGVLVEMKRHGIEADSLDVIIISHLHGDHFCGLPFLFLEYMWERPRKRPVIIAGPKNLEKRTWILMRAMFSRFNLKELQTNVKWVVLEPGEKPQARGAQAEHHQKSAYLA